MRMQSITTRLHALGALALVTAFVSVSGIFPKQASCQEGGEDEQECEHGRVYLERKEDGVYLCVDDLDCGTVTAENICFRLGR